MMKAVEREDSRKAPPPQQQQPQQPQPQEASA